MNWKEPYFLTLTVKVYQAKSLKVMIQGIMKAFKQIRDKYRQRNHRETGKKLIGIKSLECNFNAVNRTYNPHLHLILPTKEIADLLLNEWLEKWTPKFARRPGQYIRPIKDLEKDLIETIKYGSKIFTEPDVNKKTKDLKNKFIYAKALYNIFNAMEGIRIFDRFGFDLPKEEKIIRGARVVNNHYEWFFHPKYFDWLNTENELVLSGYVPTPELLNFMENNINVELE